MAYVAPDVKPSWFKPSGSANKKVLPLDSFGMQWAECDVYGDNLFRCELKSVDKEGEQHTYGYYYVGEGKWRLILPPGVFAYSGYGYDGVVGVVKDGKFEPVQGADEAKQVVVSADAVVIER